MKIKAYIPEYFLDIKETITANEVESLKRMFANNYELHIGDREFSIKNYVNQEIVYKSEGLLIGILAGKNSEVTYLREAMYEWFECELEQVLSDYEIEVVE